MHLILTADEAIIQERIRKDEQRMKELALDCLRDNISFLRAHYADAVWIQTDRRDINDIVNEAIAIIRSKEK